VRPLSDGKLHAADLLFLPARCGHEIQAKNTCFGASQVLKSGLQILTKSLDII
jgi:hypothetical protein